MGNVIGQSEVSDLAEPKPCHRLGALSRCRGVTLIELSFVIGIIAIIVVAALAVYNAVRNSQDLTTAVSDVSAIRTAVSNWAGNEPIFVTTNTGGNQTTNSRLTNGLQLQRLLPGKLRDAARNPNAGGGQNEVTLSQVNPWQGNYSIMQAVNGLQATGATDAENLSGNPFVFMIEITEIPTSQFEPLRRRLEEGSQAISESQQATEQDLGVTLQVVYRI